MKKTRSGKGEKSSAQTEHKTFQSYNRMRDESLCELLVSKQSVGLFVVVLLSGKQQPTFGLFQKPSWIASRRRLVRISASSDQQFSFCEMVLLSWLASGCGFKRTSYLASGLGSLLA